MPDDMAATIQGDVVARSEGAGILRHLDALLLRGLTSATGASIRGRLTVTLPSGRTTRTGQAGGVEAVLVVRRYRALRAILARGLVGFAESYVSGDLDTPCLADVFAFYLDNEHALERTLPGLARAGRRDRRYHASRDNTHRGSRRNISAHYDLGNAFYRLWLDSEMSYSSAVYTRPDATLEEAQAEKHRRILEALRLVPGSRVLEIGCGWGALARWMARAGADVTAITISREQHAAARESIALASLADRARIVFEDYRDTIGTYDRIVSIEMIEAVGERHWPHYFETIRDRLAPGGSAILQAITLRDDLIESYRQRPDFIQRYVFPGGMLPTVPLIRDHAASAGLGFETVERFGLSYARTLADWRDRFDEAWPRIEALGFDARFRRLWTYYLCYCEAGFRRGLIDVGLYRLSKPNLPAPSLADVSMTRGQ